MFGDRTRRNLVALFTIVTVLAASTRLTAEQARTVSADVAGPFVAWVTSPVLVGARFTVSGAGFSPGTVVNFFVSTASGGVNEGPLTPATATPTALAVDVPVDISLGQGVVAIQVVNTDQQYAASNIVMVLLQGAASAGIPSLTAINGVGLAATGIDPRFAVANVETVVPQGSEVLLQGSGFDIVNGVAIDVFCACPGGKVGPFLIHPGDFGLSGSSITLSLPSMGPYALPVGPASFRISNRGSDASYKRKSNAVSVPIGRALSVISVVQDGATLTVDGTGLSPLTVLNFFNRVGNVVVNLGGIGPTGAPAIPIVLVSPTQIMFAVPNGAVAGPAYVQALNPPFVPFSSSGDGPGGAFTLLGPSATPTSTSTAGKTPTPTATGSGPTATPTTTRTAAATPSPTPTFAAAVLLAGGVDNTISPSGGHPTLASAEIFHEVTASFRATGSMAYTRFGAAATRLENGEILVTGGYDAFSKRPLASAELYDTKTANFSLTGSMNTSRLDHTALLLGGGRVFVAGGTNVDFSAVDIAELYDSDLGQFTLMPSLVDSRTGHTATLLKNGLVLIAGGADDFSLLSTAELCDADSDGCYQAGSMSQAHQFATATRLNDGTVLIAGGASPAGDCDGCSTDSAEIYNPATNAFSPTGRMRARRQGHRASLLPNGTVLITGGLDYATSTVLDSAEIYDPSTGMFAAAPRMSIRRYQHTATVLADGRVLIAGGFDSLSEITDTAELYDPLKATFTATGPMTDSRAGHVAAALLSAPADPDK